jgi:hypothetical protein
LGGIGHLKTKAGTTLEDRRMERITVQTPPGRWNSQQYWAHLKPLRAIRNFLITCTKQFSPSTNYKSWLNQSQVKRRHSFAAQVFVLWVFALGVIDVWRGAVLWRERVLLFELGSTLSPFSLAFLVILFILTGLALIVAAASLWWQRKWAARYARIVIPLYFVLIQSYTWLFVRTGLMWQRRWVSLVLALLGISVGVGVLTWSKSRQWMGI